MNAKLARMPVLLGGFVLVLVLAIAACGTGGDPPDNAFAPSSGPVTMATFVAQADALCRRTSAFVHDGIQPYIDQGLKAVSTRPIAGGMVDAIIAPALESQVIAISTLEWPAGESEKIFAVLTAIDGVAAAARADPVEMVLDHEEALAPARRLADGYGLDDCGKLDIVPPDFDEELQPSEEEEEKDEFIEHSDALCRRAAAIVQEQFLPHVKKGRAHMHRPNVVSALENIITLELEAQNGAVQSLNPPADENREIEAVLSGFREVADRGRERPRALVFDSRQALAKARRRAANYGFDYCGKLWIVLPTPQSEARLGRVG